MHPLDQADDQIIRLCHRSSPEGFARLILAYQERVYRQAHRFLANREDALDITQEVFLSAFRAIGRFQAGRPLWPWLRRITVNACINTIRRRPSLASLDQQVVDGGPSLGEVIAGPDDVSSIAELGGLREHLVAAMEGLPPLHRLVIVLRHEQGLSYEEIAGETGLPVGTVKTYLYRARRELRRRMEPWLEA